MSRIFRPYKSFPTQKYYKTLPEKEWFGQPNGIATLDENGKLVSSQVPEVYSHNKGWFVDQSALPTTGENGDYAIVGTTDTVWVWDSDTSSWVDTDTKGQVESVNGVAPGPSGNVTITSTNIPDISETYATKTSLEDKQDKTDANLDTTDKTIVGAINELLASINANVITSTEQKRITTTSTASGVQMSTTAKACMVSINPVKTNVGAIYISTSSETAPTINPLYPDQMPKYKFPDASQVYIWSDVNGDSVDLTIEYYG